MPYQTKVALIARMTARRNCMKRSIKISQNTGFLLLALLSLHHAETTLLGVLKRCKRKAPDGAIVSGTGYRLKSRRVAEHAQLFWMIGRLNRENVNGRCGSRGQGSGPPPPHLLAHNVGFLTLALKLAPPLRVDLSPTLNGEVCGPPL